MPFLHLRYCPAADHAAPDPDELATTLRRLTAELLGKRPDVTSIQLETVPPGTWWVGAQPLARYRIGSYHLTLQITAGTNDEAQKAAFIEAVDAALRQALGTVHPASYAVLHCVPGTDWGYAGQTQAVRARRRETT